MIQKHDPEIAKAMGDEAVRMAQGDEAVRIKQQVGFSRAQTLDEENAVTTHFDFGRGRALMEKLDPATSIFVLRVTVGSEILWQNTDKTDFYTNATTFHLTETGAAALKELL